MSFWSERPNTDNRAIWTFFQSSYNILFIFWSWSGQSTVCQSQIENWILRHKKKINIEGRILELNLNKLRKTLFSNIWFEFIPFQDKESKMRSLYPRSICMTRAQVGKYLSYPVGLQIFNDIWLTLSSSSDKLTFFQSSGEIFLKMCC